ncbi:PadR family transcriptional regulator [Brevundimonas sp.]|jgi:PadR family transcriptional regulator PadR|uniref:PadR family transcriptional regulator n=1 Tax=Brevundimonas sp. TaxID=1871086 RepID=UPI0037BECB46
MNRARRPSPQTLAVLALLVQQPDDWFYGLEISVATGLKSGSLYPILIRLAERGWLESRWLEPERPGRPPRHAYRITGAGRSALREASGTSSSLILGRSPA